MAEVSNSPPLFQGWFNTSQVPTVRPNATPTPPPRPSGDHYDTTSSDGVMAPINQLRQFFVRHGAPTPAGGSTTPATGQASTPTELRPPQPKAQVQARMDAFRASMNHLYTLKGPDGKPTLGADGKPVQVRAKPAFRVSGGINQDTPPVSADKIRSALGPEALAKDPDMAKSISGLTYGRATPDNIAKVTQGLIDAGKLPTDANLSSQDKVRKMMWDYGIGLDCAGYVSQAAPAGAGTTPGALGTSIPTSLASGLRLANNPNWQTVPQQAGQAPQAEAGDVMRLRDRSGDMGHWVAVYDHHGMSGSEVDGIKQQLPGNAKASAFFGSNPSSVQSYTVDSSWGAGGDWRNEQGGVNRDRWFYNSDSKQWAESQMDSKGHRTFQLTDGPYDHDLVGVFRPNPGQ